MRLLIGVADETKRWALYDQEPLERWTAGRVALLGDAAHAIRDCFAQGAAQAIEDAVVWAGCLREARSDSIVAALLRYEALRKPRASRVQRLSRTRGEPWPRGDGWHLPDGEEQRQRDARFVQADPLRTNAWLYAHDAERGLTGNIGGDGQGGNAAYDRLVPLAEE